MLKVVVLISLTFIITSLSSREVRAEFIRVKTEKRALDLEEAPATGFIFSFEVFSGFQYSF